MKYGYARCSTAEQDLTIQVESLTAAGCDVIREEKVSGASLDKRNELKTLLEFLREGDELVVTRIDRLARSLRDLQNIIHILNEKGVTLSATEQPIDTSSSIGKCFIDLLGLFAEFEHRIRYERQMEGIAKAKSAGKYKGRKKSINTRLIKELYEQGKRVSDIAKEVGCSRQSVYRFI
ncbi:MAG: recombinase family protein [Proteobacteria bacterium]|nr:recombinase family protein [Pseudomonadota bacterium]MDA1295762.1 recombinase family protein [Pseudomonadota bacterium]